VTATLAPAQIMPDLFDGPRAKTNAIRFALLCVALSVPSAVAPVRLLMVGLLAALFWRYRVRTLIPMYLILTLIPESPADRAFLGLWNWPIQNLGLIWYGNVSTAVPGVPIKLAPSLMAAMFLLWRCYTGRVGERCKHEPMLFVPTRAQRSVILTAIVAGLFWTAYGQLRGGDLTYAFYGVTPMIHIACLIGVAMCVCDRELLRLLVNIMVGIAAIRGLLAVYLYVTRFRYVYPPTLFITTHADSMVWAVSMVALLAKYVEQPTVRRRRILAGGWFILGLAIVVNTRRLSFVILAVSLVYLVFSTRRSGRRRLSQAMPLVLPLAIGYLVIGLLAPPSQIFAPIQSVKSVSEAEDSSSLTREAENYNVILSMKEHSILGTGFGFPYRERVLGGDISTLFAGYLYLPHNNLLGLLFFAGPFGAALMLMPAVLAMQRSHRTRRWSDDADARMVAGVAVSAGIGYVLQAWGDFGLTDLRVFGVAGIFLGGCSGLLADASRPTGGDT
jgi:energy-coupling factor transporter transmembrane protein EcfT